MRLINICGVIFCSLRGCCKISNHTSLDKLTLLDNINLIYRWTKKKLSRDFVECYVKFEFQIILLLSIQHYKQIST